MTLLVPQHFGERFHAIRMQQTGNQDLAFINANGATFPGVVYAENLVG